MNLKKVLVVLSVFALAVMLGVSMFSGGKTRAAAPCAVPSISYSSIQAAANDPGCTEIDVAAGAYFENVVVNNPTTIKGAQAGTDARGRAGLESTVNGANPIAGNSVFMIKAAGVTIDGFTIKNSITTGAAIGIDIKNTATGAVITNNIIDGVSTTDTSSNGTGQGVYLETGPDNVTVSQNDIKNVSGDRSTKGVQIGDGGSTNPSINVVIDANSISNITSTTRGSYGVSINNGNGSTSNTGLVITNNTISNLTGGWVHAIGLEAKTPGVLVTGNTISNLTGPAVDTVGVWLEGEEGSSFATALVNGNNFNLPSTQFGVAVDPGLSTAFPTLKVDGTCNWWGAPNGPSGSGSGSGCKVSPNVKYSPWDTAPEPAGDCNGQVPANKDQCKDGGWQTLFRANGTGFKNQGDCIQYVNTGK
jgi:Right handed beta helix region